jgi:hypothetical protein
MWLVGFINRVQYGKELPDDDDYDADPVWFSDPEQ